MWAVWLLALLGACVAFAMIFVFCGAYRWVSALASTFVFAICAYGVVNLWS